MKEIKGTCGLNDKLCLIYYLPEASLSFMQHIFLEMCLCLMQGFCMSSFVTLLKHHMNKNAHSSDEGRIQQLH